ncbi:MAG: S41 family peptidase, partial [Longimicrobiales bacterium]
GTLGFYRYPAIHGDVIVFAAEGDLWRVPVTGGVATRITTHLGEETSPRISPDGATLAFTASYEGPAEVYTMPLAGGLPVRRSYEADASVATTWTPDGRLVYTTSAYSTLPQNQLVALDLEENRTERIPLYTASEGVYDESGSTLFFVRPAFHNNVTKRYTGGTARDVWRFGPEDEEAVELTGDYNGESHSPMAWDGRVYFVSDRDGTMNIWSMDPDGGNARQHTRHSGWDVKNPNQEGGRIVYQLGADLWLYDIGQDRSAKIPITLSSDFDQLRERWVDDPMEYLTSVHLHPEGESVVLTARGRVFVAPVEKGRLVQASVKPGVRYRDVTFLPDGESLAGLSDETGEFEWVTLPANGIGEGRSLTSDGAILRFRGHPSPDGKWLAYTDNNADLWVLNVETRQQTLVSTDREGVGSMSWAPDSRWLAYEKTADNDFVQIRLFRPDEGTRAPVTSNRTNSFSPAWDPDGQFLYFLSDRNLESVVSAPWGPRAPGPYFDRHNEIFVVSLQAGVRSPFAPDHELVAGEEEGRGTTTDSTGQDRSREGSENRALTPEPVQVDLDGLMYRVKRVPVRPGNYRDLSVTGDALFFGDRAAGQFGGGNLMAVEITRDDPELVTLAENVSSYELSADGKKMLLRQGSNLYVVDARPARISQLNEHRVDLSGWAFPMDVREDWRQIFIDAWRMERDYFYDPGMHGVDWEGVRDKYLPLVDRVTTRDELSDLIGRVVGELSALHTSVRGGDLRTGEENIRIASLGARLVRTPEEGGYIIDYIYRTDPDYPDEMSPLADPDLGISEGDVIQAVNGQEVLSVPAIGALLRNQTRQVRLRVKPGSSGSPRDVMVTPTLNERNLRYQDWEYTRRLKVEEAGNGQIGYLHLTAMGGGNITEFYRNFYPVFNRPGLIIDVRRNSGGNIDSIILEQLLRQAWMYWKDRVGEPYWNMQYAFRGHMVVLVDQNTASDGEAFADGFRRLSLGPVIGMRTWGGEIWLSSSNRLTDGGLARAPMMGVYGPEGEWLIEQIGVVPDIEVDNLPHATFLGEDAQLDAAIRYLQARIAEDPRPVPPPPPYPNRGFTYPAAGGGNGVGGDRR